MDKLGYEVYHLIPWYSPSHRPQCFSNGECSTMFTALCRKYKYIIINEVTSDGYGYLNSVCDSKIIFEINNRIDVHVPGESLRQYQANFAQVLNNKNRDVSIVINTEYENYYACKQGIFLPEYYIIRSTGINFEMPDLSTIERIDKIAIVDKYNQDISVARTELNKRNIPFEIIPSNNNYIKTLSYYKAQLILPHQATTRIMENFKNGIVMMIPSQNFFREMIDEEVYSFDAKDIIRVDDGLEKYTDWYNEDYEDFFVYFNSWDDVRGLMHSVDFDKIRNKAMKYAEEIESEIIEQWNEVISDNDKKKHMIKHKKPTCQSDSGSFYNYN